jgi:hypothetical protein
MVGLRQTKFVTERFCESYVARASQASETISGAGQLALSHQSDAKYPIPFAASCIYWQIWTPGTELVLMGVAEQVLPDGQSAGPLGSQT